MSKTFEIFKSASDKSVKREFRRLIVNELNKIASELEYNPEKMELSTRTDVLKTERSSKEKQKDYNFQQDHKDSDAKLNPVPRSLSTRYSPDRVGVMSRRISDGVHQDPISGKIFDWNEGFKTEDGEEIHGGSVSHQSDVSFGR